MSHIPLNFVDCKTEPTDQNDHVENLDWEMGIESDFNTFIKNEEYIEDKKEDVKLEINNALPLDEDKSKEGSLDKCIKTTNDRVYICNHCCYQTNKIEMLDKHKRFNHGLVYYKCDQCPLKTTQQNALKSHIENIHKRIVYPCGQCNYKATIKINLQYHMQYVHEKGKITYPCSQCDFIATIKEDLKKHIKYVHIFIEGCDVCDFKCIDKLTLREHTKAVHNKVVFEEGGKATDCYDCDQCDLKFASKKILTLHNHQYHRHQQRVNILKTAWKGKTKKVSGVTQSFICEKCELVFQTEKILSKHKMKC